MEKIADLEGLYEVLEMIGYDPVLAANSVAISLEMGDKTVMASLAMPSALNAVVVNCQVGTLADIDEAKRPDFLAAALVANQTVNPFAFSLVVDETDHENQEK